MTDGLLVREIEPADFDYIIRYWTGAGDAYLESLGVDLSKRPVAGDLRSMLEAQYTAPYLKKKSYALIWEAGGRTIGHCNINDISFGREAKMHLHIWEAADRRKGFGVPGIRWSVPLFFEKMKLERLYCEPHANNTAPNSALARAGFHFVKEYVTVPGPINFEQPVNQWLITRDDVKGMAG